MSQKIIIQTAKFQSKSNPQKYYETRLYEDGTMSCNCPAWTLRTYPDGSRFCKHLIGAGFASPDEMPAKQPTRSFVWSPVKADADAAQKPEVKKAASKEQPQATVQNALRRFAFDD